MPRDRVVRSLTVKALIVGVLIAAVIASPSPAAASLQSAFCRPHRTVQSFGGGTAQGFAAYLVVAPGSVRPGRYTTFRIVNEGTDELSEEGGRVQRWTGSSWIRMPEAGGPTFGGIAFVHPRSVSACTGPLTGKHWQPGKYRFLLEVEAIEKSREPTQPEHHWLGATFLIRRGSD